MPLLRKSKTPDTFVTAQDWFESGHRIPYDPVHKRIVSRSTAQTLNVFENVIDPSASSRWLTLLPGFPAGSYGYAKIDDILEANHSLRCPRLYVDYVGQGDSDKPKDYKYSTMERADLIQALWQHHKVRKTVVVTFDFSSLVLLELLRRKHDSPSSLPTIEHVLIVNGSLFADGYSKSHKASDLLQSSVGRFSPSLAVRSLVKAQHSSTYRQVNRKLYNLEVMETKRAMARHGGLQFARHDFVKEHGKHAERWNLYNLCVHRWLGETTVAIVGSDKDKLERKQMELARDRLGDFYPQVRLEKYLLEGHATVTENARELADQIVALAQKTNGLGARVMPSWTTLEDAPMSFSPPTQGRKLPPWVTR